MGGALGFNGFIGIVFVFDMVCSCVQLVCGGTLCCVVLS